MIPTFVNNVYHVYLKSTGLTALLSWWMALLVACFAAITPVAFCDSPDSTIAIQPNLVIAHISPAMLGSCIEDVNHEIYGGLYDQKLFGESFEEPSAPAPIAGWTSYGGSWTVDGVWCRVANDQGAKLVSDVLPFTDGQVDADVEIGPRETGNAGLLVRVSNPSVGTDVFDGYEISLDPSAGTVILGKHVHNWQPLITCHALLNSSGINHVTVKLLGNKITVYVNSNPVPVIDYSDNGTPLLSGKVALRTWGTDASFSNLKLTTTGTVKDLPFVLGPQSKVNAQWDKIDSPVGTGQYTIDSANPFNGNYSLKLTHGAAPGDVGVSNAGLNHWGIAVKKNQLFQGSIYLRSTGLLGAVTCALESSDGKSIYAHQAMQKITNTWTKFTFDLKSTADDPDARFAFWFSRPGTIWADEAVLMGTGAERFHGLPARADIAKMLQGEGVSLLRYGGTMVNVPGYRWKNMIGDRDRRPPYEGNWYPYSSNGFGIFDFLNFCEAAKIGSAFAINIDETDQDAADLADYLTAPVSNAWGKQRAADGHPAPYRVKYIEIGNEEVIGGDSDEGYAHYIQRFRAIAAAIHSRNPSLELVCAAWWRPESLNMRKVFDAVNGLAAAWDVHVWCDDARAGADVDREISHMQNLFNSWDPNSKLKAVIFEENGNLHSMQRALGHATTLNATLRHGDFVVADCAANCLQPLGENDNGWDQGQIFFTPSEVWGMPPYYAQQMVAAAYLPLVVDCNSSSPNNDLTVTCLSSLDSKIFSLLVVNTGDVPHDANISCGSTASLRSVSDQVLIGEPSDVNTASLPTLIAPRATNITNNGATLSAVFPAYSYSVIRCTIR